MAATNINAATRESFLHILADIGDADDLAKILALDDAALQARLLPVVAESAELRGVKPAGDLLGDGECAAGEAG